MHKSRMRQGYFFSPDLFNPYSKMILSKLEDLWGFIIGKYNLNYLRYMHDTVLLADLEKETERRLTR